MPRGCSGATRCAARTRTRGSSSSTSPRRCSMPGVHAVLTHADVPGAKTYGLEFADQPVLAIDRVRYLGEPVALIAAEHPEQARRAAERSPGRVRAARARRRPRARDRAGAAASREPDRGPRIPRRPAAERPPDDRDHARRPGDRGRRLGQRRLRARPAGPGLPRARVGPGRARRRGRRGRLRGDAVGSRRPRPGRALPRARAGAGADPPLRGRRRVRRARGPLDAGPRRAARAAHEPAR